MRLANFSHASSVLFASPPRHPDFFPRLLPHPNASRLQDARELQPRRGHAGQRSGPPRSEPRFRGAGSISKLPPILAGQVIGRGGSGTDHIKVQNTPFWPELGRS